MTFNFEDKISKDYISVFINHKDLDFSVYPFEAKINWQLNVEVTKWGIDNFSYDLNKLSVNVLTENDDIEDELLFEVTKDYDKGYLFSIYKEFTKNKEWVKEKQFESLISLKIDEKPTTSVDSRSQIFVKEITLDLSRDTKTLTLEI